MDRHSAALLKIKDVNLPERGPNPDLPERESPEREGQSQDLDPLEREAALADLSIDHQDHVGILEMMCSHASLNLDAR